MCEPSPALEQTCMDMPALDIRFLGLERPVERPSEGRQNGMSAEGWMIGLRLDWRAIWK
jgi:hypothetical protein